MRKINKYTDRVGTNILCSAQLKATAKARGISLSNTLEEALAIKLALPVDRAEVEQALERSEAEIKALEGQLVFIDGQKQLLKDKETQKQRVVDREIVRKFWTPNGSQKFSKALRMFCEKYDVSYAEAYKEVMK